MVDLSEFKSKVESLLSQDYQVEFLGKNFEKTVSLLTKAKAERIYSWIGKVVSKEIQPILIASKKPYKDWVVKDLLTFRYPFKVNNTEYRILFVKVKNSIYIEFHLGDHKYYDKIRKDLNLKKSSY
tara:strand:- start:3189 stop:3566 length:378 start_codon:yes stop_codon:yes gene_type:complete